MASTLEQLKAMTVVVADTGDFESESSSEEIVNWLSRWELISKISNSFYSYD